MTALCPKRAPLGHWWRIPQPPKPQIGECQACHEKRGFEAVVETRYGYYNRETGRRRVRHEIDLDMPGWRVGYEPQNLGEAARAWRK